MPRKTEAGLIGLRLALPGAPETPHWVAGLPGYFWQNASTPCGGPGEPTLEQARAAHEAPGVPVVLVQMSPEEVEQRRAEIAEFRGRSRSALTRAVREEPRQKYLADGEADPEKAAERTPTEVDPKEAAAKAVDNKQTEEG